MADEDDLRALDLFVDRQIELNGFGVVAIDGECKPPFAYSAGLALMGLPDLIVFGFAPQQASAVIRSAAQRLIDGQAYDGVSWSGIFKGFRVSLHAVSAAAAHDHFMPAALRCTSRHDRSAGGVVQIFWPDAQGKMPLEPDCDEAVRAVQMQIAFA